MQNFDPVCMEVHCAASVSVSDVPFMLRIVKCLSIQEAVAYTKGYIATCVVIHGHHMC